MAFHQTARQASQRVFHLPAGGADANVLPQQSSQPVEDSQTWVLFSPGTDVDTASSYLTPTRKSNITAGRSRVSDIGTLNTPARSDFSVGQHRSASLLDALDEAEDDAELDSLDSHLSEFRSNPNIFSSTQTHPHNSPVVPTHDGLGSFRLEQEGMGPDAQDRLYAFEQYNPRRVRRRRESFELAQAQLEDEEAREMDKMRRIESWRLEQSRLLLEEIQKETKRRRRSTAGGSGTRAADRTSEDAAAAFNVEDKEDQGDEWHDQSASDSEAGRGTIWGRITRKVVRDMLGIDDEALAILFGEALPSEEEPISTPRASAMQSPQHHKSSGIEHARDHSWQLKMLERIAIELGQIIHHLSEHPGAFSTFSRVQQMPIPYAGLPSIPEGTSDAKPGEIRDADSVAMPEFKPTVGTQTRPVKLAQRRASHSSSVPTGGAQEPAENSGPASFTQEEWEQDLDIRLVFRYLRSRFMPRSSTSNSGGGGLSGNPSHRLVGATSSSTQDVAAKVARVRQHHPLVSASRSRPNFKPPPSPVQLFRPAAASSCASHSTRNRSGVRKSSAGGSSSRHYWDIGGGSVGTGSLIATTGPLGSWGDV
ncbi:hypothetical protein DL770_010803 [Monosporascus sp. CRB-9-2]|nr:hypothetical protein DL770_010803 [Monosporascus sp. CRB-9-2]